MTQRISDERLKELLWNTQAAQMDPKCGHTEDDVDRAILDLADARAHRVEGEAMTRRISNKALAKLHAAITAEPDIEVIQKIVSDFFHIHLADLKSKKRTQHIAFCRQVAMYLCRKMTNNSISTIGEHFGRDHSTVIHAFNLIHRRISNNSAFRFSIEKIERELNTQAKEKL